jgi:hypothetical protein
LASERAVAVGFWPDGQADAVAAGSEIASCLLAADK